MPKNVSGGRGLKRLKTPALKDLESLSESPLTCVLVFLGPVSSVVFRNIASALKNMEVIVVFLVFL